MKTIHRRFERFKKALFCPDCQADLIFTGSEATCEKCSVAYPIRNGKIYFIEVPNTTDELDTIKNRLKKWLGKYYYSIGINILAPTFPFHASPDDFMRFTREGQKILFRDGRC
jgi:hypothetical protein